MTSELTLVLCLERFWPAHGGVERYTLEIARCMSRSASVIVIAVVRQDRPLRDELLGSPGSRIESADVIGPGVKILTLGLGTWKKWLYKVLTITESVAHRAPISWYYGVRWICQYLTARLLATDARSLLSVPEGDVIVHSMGPWEASLVGDLLFPHATRISSPFIHAGHWGEDRFSRKWFRSRHRLIALSEADRRSCHLTGVPPNHINVVPLIGPEPDGRAQKRVRRCVVFLGVARPYKGLEVFIEMARILRGEGHGFRFIYAGSIPFDGARNAATARAAGIEVWGAITEEAKGELLAQSLCLCLPSASEITPYVILESWAAGTPVVATDTPELKEFVGTGGLLVTRTPTAFADAVRGWMLHPDLAEETGKRGFRRLRTRHDPALVGLELRRVYDEALTS